VQKSGCGGTLPEGERLCSGKVISYYTVKDKKSASKKKTSGGKGSSFGGGEEKGGDPGEGRVGARKRRLPEKRVKKDSAAVHEAKGENSITETKGDKLFRLRETLTVLSSPERPTGREGRPGKKTSSKI